MRPLEHLVEGLETGALHPATADQETDESHFREGSGDDASTPLPATADTHGRNTAEPAPAQDDTDPAAVPTDGASERAASAGVAAFAERELSYAQGNTVPFRPVYEQYEEFIASREFERMSDQKFTAAIQMHFAARMTPNKWEGIEPVTTDTKWYGPWEETVYCLVGVELCTPSILDDAAPDSS